MKGDCLGAVTGASNRGAPRGARAQRQPDLASDARPRNGRESFPTRSRLPSEPTSKSKKEKPRTLDAAATRRTTGTRPARDEQRPGDCRTFERRRVGWKMRWKIVSEPVRKTVSKSRLPAQGDQRPPRFSFVQPVSNRRLAADWRMSSTRLISVRQNL